jgi:hypothetical protein
MERKDTSKTLSDASRGLLASIVAGFAGRCCCHPMDTIKAQLQAGSSTKPVFALRALYRGLGVSLIGGVPATAIYLNTYDLSKAQLQKQNLPDFITFLSAGMIAEAVSCIVFVPVDVIKERMQVQGLGNSKNKSSMYYHNTIDALKQITKNEGIFGFYKGYNATLLSFGPFSAVYFALYENFKPIVANYFNDGSITKKNGNDTFISNLVASAGAGALGSWLTNPLDLAKLRLQIARMGSNIAVGPETVGLNLHSTLGMLKYVYRTQGITGLYRGAFTRILFHAPNTAVTMVAFEESKKILQNY